MATRKTRKTRKTSPRKAAARKAGAGKAAPKRPARKKTAPRRPAARARFPHAETVICTYRVKEGREAEMLELIGRHWPTLRRMKLTTPERPVVFQGQDDSGKTFIVEVFSWVDSEAASRAHHSPEVMAVWGPMGDLVEERLGRPGMEFPHVKPAFVQFKKT